jgi:CBS domain-containing protein
MKVREIMTSDVAFASVEDTVEAAARMMEEHDTGALPICNQERRIEGMVTDRDIALKVVARGLDPKATTIGDISPQAEVVTIGADDSIDETLETMKRYAVRRLPVIDGHEVVGMVSQGDLAKHVPERDAGELVESISSAP